MRHPIITLLVDDEARTFVEFRHAPDCEDDCDDGKTPRLFAIPQVAAMQIAQGIGTLLRNFGEEVRDDETIIPRPAELDDPDRKRLN